MKKIKEIFNTPEKLTDSYNILFLIYVMFGFFVSVMVGTTLNYWLQYLVPFMYAGYFFYIKTYYGKRKFKRLSKIVGYINIVIILCCIMFFMYDLFFVDSLYRLISLLSYLLTLFLSLYWVVVFLVDKERKKKIFNLEKSNSNWFDIIAISFIGLNVISYVIYIFDYGIVDYFLLNIASTIFMVLLYIMVLRYIYLYQKHIEEGEIKNV